MQLTQEQLAELMAKVYTNLDEKRKSRKEDGNTGITEEILAEVVEMIDEKRKSRKEDGDNVGSTEEILAEVVEMLDEKRKSRKEDGGISTAEELLAEVVEMIDEKRKSRKEDGESEDAKSAKCATPRRQPVTQRKYSDIFLSASASRDGSRHTSGFKTRITSMSAPERSKTAYGMFGRAVKCINASNGDIERAAYTAEHKFMDTEMAHEFKALSATVPGDGGYLVPEVYANEIIELLYPATVVYSLGARRLGMSNGNLNIPKLKTGSRALFTGENRQIPKNAPKFGNLKLSAKKLTALVPMSNDLLRSTNFDNDVIVGQDITKQMALGVDWGALRGDGSEFQPLGITNNKNVLNIDATSLDAAYSGSDGTLTAAFPNYIVAAVLKNNVYADGLGFAFNTSVEQYFKSLRDNVGGFIFAEEMNKNNTLAGYPYKTTTLFATVGGKTQIIFGNWNDLIIGEQGALEIETSREGSWTDDAGNLVSAFENDQTLIRAINNVDAGLRHDESFAVASKVAVPI